VVGLSDLLNDSTFHAFLWTRETRMRDLGTLPGDFASVGVGISDRGEVVGASLAANFNPRAFLWENGAMTDLNTLIVANPSGLYLQLAESINASGEIIGFAQASNGDTHGFLATLSNGQAGGESFSAAAQGAASPMVSDEDAHRLLQHRLRFGRFGSRIVGPQ
jgi:probable HAF family extracellular repeat protein